MFYLVPAILKFLRVIYRKHVVFLSIESNGKGNDGPCKRLPGTTLAECKSGYGLDTDNEIKMLKVLNQGINDPEVSMDISVTYCGAHSVPKSVVLCKT